MTMHEGACTKATIIIQFRVTQRQLNLIENKKETLGYTTRSAFIKDFLLKDDLSVHSKLNQIIELVKERKK